jgi:hypothetical protein
MEGIPSGLIFFAVCQFDFIKDKLFYRLLHNLLSNSQYENLYPQIGQI